MKFISKKIILQKLKHFFPYDQNIFKKYFVYNSFFLLLVLFITLLNCFYIIVAIKEQTFSHLNTMVNFNFALTPIFSLFLAWVSWILLLIAPQQIHRSSKKSIVFFYVSYWCLTIAVLLNGATGNLYFKNFINSELKLTFLATFTQVLLILTIYSVVLIQIYFWIMRRKFTFSPTDYEIYTTRAEKKRLVRNTKAELKLDKKRKNQK